MKILALEFSSSVRGVSVTGGVKSGSAEEAGGRETKPFALIDAALREAGMTRMDELIKAADNALYDAKRAGRDRVAATKPAPAAVRA